jgi:hypothetical protein
MDYRLRTLKIAWDDISAILDDLEMEISCSKWYCGLDHHHSFLATSPISCQENRTCGQHDDKRIHVSLLCPRHRVLRYRFRERMRWWRMSSFKEQSFKIQEVLQKLWKDGELNLIQFEKCEEDATQSPMFDALATITALLHP